MPVASSTFVQAALEGEAGIKAIHMNLTGITNVLAESHTTSELRSLITAIQSNSHKVDIYFANSLVEGESVTVFRAGSQIPQGAPVPEILRPHLELGAPPPPRGGGGGRAYGSPPGEGGGGNGLLGAIKGVGQVLWTAAAVGLSIWGMAQALQNRDVSGYLSNSSFLIAAVTGNPLYAALGAGIGYGDVLNEHYGASKEVAAWAELADEKLGDKLDPFLGGEGMTGYTAVLVATPAVVLDKSSELSYDVTDAVLEGIYGAVEGIPGAVRFGLEMGPGERCTPYNDPPGAGRGASACY